MATNYVPGTFTGGNYSLIQLTAEFEKIRAELDDKLSRSESADNDMQETLDLNGQRVINAANGVNPGDVATMQNLLNTGLDPTVAARLLQAEVDILAAAAAALTANGKADTNSGRITLNDADIAALQLLTQSHSTDITTLQNELFLLTADVNAAQVALLQEIADRTSGDNQLNVAIQVEASNRQVGDTTLAGQIGAEAATRATNDDDLQDQIDNIVAGAAVGVLAVEVPVGAGALTLATEGAAAPQAKVPDAAVGDTIALRYTGTQNTWSQGELVVFVSGTGTFTYDLEAPSGGQLTPAVFDRNDTGLFVVVLQAINGGTKGTLRFIGNTTYNTRINAASAVASSANTKADTLIGRADITDTEQATQDGRLDAIEAEQTTQNSDISDNATAIGVSQGNISALSGRTDTLEGRADITDTEQTAQDNAITAVDTKADTNAGRADGTDLEQAVQDGRLDAIETEQGTQNTRLDGIDFDQTVQNSRLDGIDMTNSSQTSDISDNATAIGVSQGNISTLSGRADTLEGRADITDTEQASQDAAITAVDDKADTLAGRADITDLEQATQDGRLDTLEAAGGGAPYFDIFIAGPMVTGVRKWIITGPVSGSTTLALDDLQMRLENAPSGGNFTMQLQRNGVQLDNWTFAAGANYATHGSTGDTTVLGPTDRLVFISGGTGTSLGQNLAMQWPAS